MVRYLGHVQGVRVTVWESFITTPMTSEPRITRRITRLPSQAIHGNTFGRYPARRAVTVRDLQQEAEAAREAYLIDGWQDDRPMV